MNFTFKRRFEVDKMEWVNADYDFNKLIEELKLKWEEKEKGNSYFSFILIKQWFYCAATAPDFQFCFDWQDFEYFLKKEKFFCAGDIIQIWLLSDNDLVFDKKIPDESNLIPKEGSY